MKIKYTQNLFKPVTGSTINRQAIPCPGWLASRRLLNYVGPTLSIQQEMINDILEKNHATLKELITNNTYTDVPEHILRDKGFDFKYFTHPYETEQKIIFSVCYNLVYRRSEDGPTESSGKTRKGAFGK